MAYTKNYPVWGSGSCCGTPDPGPVTVITKGVLNNYEQAHFDAHNMEAATAGTFQQTSKVVGDANVRYQQDADGTIHWGGGTAVPDTQLLRVGPSLMATDGSWVAVRSLGSQTWASQVTGDSNPRWTVTSDGIHRWSDGTAAADVILYRSAPNVLRIEDQFSIYRVGQAADAELRLSRDAGFLANIRMRTGTLDRWGIQADNSAEAGANAGSNLMFQRFDDAGVFISNVLNMNRATGVVSITSPGLANGAVVSVDGAQPITNKTIQGTGATSTTSLLSHKVTGDTQIRWNVDASGTMGWSPGAGAIDTTFGRTAAGQLGTNSDVHSTRSLSTVAAFSANVTGDSNNRWQVTTAGTMTWGAGSGATDCTFGRSAAGVLRSVSTAIQVTQTNATFGAIQAMVVGADTQPRFGVLAGGDIQWGPGNAAVDCTFTRTGVGAMTLSAAIRINGNVGFYNTAPVAKPTVTGSRGGNAALASLLTALASQGLITDSSTA